MNILGISGQERDAAAALVRDGKVVAAIEEAKLARIRHVGMNYSGGLPYRAIEFCLDRAGITFDDIDYAAYYLDPRKLFHREIAFNSSLAIHAPGPAFIEEFPSYFVDSLNGLKQRLRTRRLIESHVSGRGQFVTVAHHLAHGASAFYSSSFARAAVISVDNKGDMTSTALMTGDGGQLALQAEAQFPNSIGLVYSAVSAALGFSFSGDWHKTMWLSPTGQPQYADLFADLLAVDEGGLPVVNLEYFDMSSRGNPSLSDRFFERAELPRRPKDKPVGRKHRDLAASLQARVEDVLCEIASRHRARTGEENLCLAGGVALNSLANSAIERRAGFKRLFVQPAAGNAGCSIGAALYVWHQMLGNGERAYQMQHAFLGPQCHEEDIKSVLDNCKLNYEYYLTEDKLIGEIARLLAQGRITGWFRGAMEFGPRTLGARSILASPTSEMMRENLNVYIKQREDYRPFSAAVPEEHAEEFFEPSALTDFLQGVSRIKEGKQQLIPAAVFGDGLVRVHTVSRKTNASFWKLLMKFGEVAGVPVLLNTSFNLFGEPVVSTPREAVRGFYCSGIDCLAIGNFLIKK
ncbi:MAG TPA: carbamoyltransferase C-terminal domain-containing protein [Blastocatellia bacterium]|jgi:carbamoyltransferase|nr:carbamoyltransferase C-terminal domain-containing protein [Blastocatellia bacterium]